MPRRRDRASGPASQRPQRLPAADRGGSLREAMNAQEFEEALRQYPVVPGRDRNYCKRPLRSASGAKAPTPLLTAAGEAEEASAEQVFDSDLGFWENLMNVLRTHYSEDEADAIHRHFRTMHNGLIFSLNLDDVEDIARLARESAGSVE